MKYLSGRGLIVILTMAGVSLLGARGVCLAVNGGSPPGALMVVPAADPGDVILYWTATGDDGYVGRAAGYDMRYLPYNLGPIDTEQKWALAYHADGEPIPRQAGQIDSMVVRGLTPGADYYFCIKAYDEAGNYSALSNSPLAQAAGGDFVAGDVNGSGVIDGLDVIYLVNYLKGGTRPPDPILRADCNGDCAVNGSDILFIVDYFRGGPAPHRGNCDIILSKDKSNILGH